MSGFGRALALALAIACGGGAAGADLPSLTTTRVDVFAAYAKERARHRELAELQKELAAALARLGENASAKRLLELSEQPTVALAIAQWSFLEAGGATLAALEPPTEGADLASEFAAWLLGDIDTLGDAFLTGQPPKAMSAAIEILFRIWREDRSCESGLARRLAVAVALEHATPIVPWSEWDAPGAKPIDALARYRFYRDLDQRGVLFPCFRTLPTWELRRVVDLPLYDEDIAWFHTSLPERLPGGAGDPPRPPLRSQKEIGNAAFLVPYRDTNPKNGMSVQLGKPFYDGKRLTPAVMLEYGGVCGAVSKFGSFAARAFGVPAQPLGQEGHCALGWKDGEGHWRTANCGSEADWSVSNLHGLWGGWSARGEAIPMMLALDGAASFRTSVRAMALCHLAKPDDKKRLVASLEIAAHTPNNVVAWRAVLEWLRSRERVEAEDLRRFARAAIAGLPAAPQIALDLLTQLELSKPFAALAQKERDRYIDDVVDAFAERTDPVAFREVLGRSLWLTTGKVSSLGDWPYLAHLSILDGTHQTMRDWWKAAGDNDRKRVADRLLRVATKVNRPDLAEVALPRLLSLCDADESLRGRTQSAAHRIAEAHVAAGRREQALRVYRSLILAGERLGYRSWIETNTERALALRAAPPSAEAGKEKTPRNSGRP